MPRRTSLELVKQLTHRLPSRLRREILFEVGLARKILDVDNQEYSLDTSDDEQQCFLLVAIWKLLSILRSILALRAVLSEEIGSSEIDLGRKTLFSKHEFSQLSLLVGQIEQLISADNENWFSILEAESLKELLRSYINGTK